MISSVSAANRKTSLLFYTYAFEFCIFLGNENACAQKSAEDANSFGLRVRTKSIDEAVGTKKIKSKS